ncbi:GNAT family N-acetyltransferase [Pseudoalteromonas aliena]|uniref:GNAT family N-acetyltransferase n=1 Tax=Pseudoalteromonas aliena TaxID=247523 RepID=A0A1Q2GU31_9GAMM|nr:GNAT family N-acetyltransferase [Pseudoalteromonas aliena]AQP98500.1 GNAT family N-acetyltransferase [Pseudoalteromonas aliena]
MLIIRKFQNGDELTLREIFFNTIRNVNIKDYSEVQVQAWAPDDYDQPEWYKRISAINPFVAILNGEVVGYADVQDDGYIDHFFCHWKHQGKGIGKALIQTITSTGRKESMDRLYCHASITAKPFFEYFGFKEVKKQQVKIRGQVLTNYVLEKCL